MKSDFFKIESHEKYYIIGLLFSDGYLGQNSNCNKEYVGLKLIDKQILDDISTITECRKPFNVGKTSANKQLYKIEFRDNNIVNDLKQIGLHRRKTLTIEYPNIPEKYHRDFIRGEFDGDGCIHFALKKDRVNSYVTNFQIIGTVQLLEGIAKHIGVNVRIIPYKKVAKLLVDKKDDLKKIYNFLYSDENCLCLQRKHIHFKECIETIATSQENQKKYIKKQQEPRITTEEFIRRAREIHSDKYDYSKTVFKNNQTKVIITCPIHGDFEQFPYHHLRGNACRQCGLNKIHEQLKNSLDTFIKRAREIHGDKYDYSKVEYKNSKEKVCIICPVHGEFWQTPSNHLMGKGCRQCGLEKRSAERRKKNNSKDN
jgi:intein-encoded DNA endonuclease-like protein